MVELRLIAVSRACLIAAWGALASLLGLLGEVGGISGLACLPAAGSPAILLSHLFGPCVVSLLEQVDAFLVAMDLTGMDLARKRAGTATVPAVGVRTVVNRTRAVISRVVAAEPWIVVAAAVAVVVAADTGVVKPAAAAGVNKGHPATGKTVAIRVSIAIADPGGGIVIRVVVVAGGKQQSGGCQK